MKKNKFSQSEMVRKILQDKLAVFSIIVLLLIIVAAVLAPFLTDQDPTKVDVIKRLLPPAWCEGGNPENLLGTDSLGRDVYARLLYGARLSLTVALVSVVVSGVIGVVLGLIAGYFGGVIDAVIMRITEIQMAFPFILLAISILAVLGPGVKNIIIVISITGWVDYARIVRGQVLSCKQKEYVEAAYSMGLPAYTIMFKHILRNIWAPVLVIANTAIAGNIVLEASLSFLGLGVGPEVSSWGMMLNDGREFVTKAWWLCTIPGVAIMLTVMSVNIFGDWLRDYMDPKIKK